MRAAVFHKQENGGIINLEDVDIPQINRPDEVLIEIKACGICGTDLKILEGGHPANDNTILGHEFAGVIKDLGDHVNDLKIGDKVVVDPNEKCGYCKPCRRGNPNLCEYMAMGTTFGIFQDGGFANYCVVPRKTIFELPNNTDLISAALIEPLSCAVHCHNIADVKESDNVVIIGAGPMGILIESVIRMHPIKNLISLEINEWRREKAYDIGADYVINPQEQDINQEIKTITNGKGADIIIDAVGISQSFETALSIWGHGAKIVCFGQDSRAEVSIKPNDLVRYQRKILGSYIGHTKDFLDAIVLISNDLIETKKIITHQISLDDLLSKGFELMKSRKCTKIIVKP